jgi:hypothetical protein
MGLPTRSKARGWSMRMVMRSLRGPSAAVWRRPRRYAEPALVQTGGSTWRPVLSGHRCSGGRPLPTTPERRPATARGNRPRVGRCLIPELPGTRNRSLVAEPTQNCAHPTGIKRSQLRPRRAHGGAQPHRGERGPGHGFVVEDSSEVAESASGVVLPGEEQIPGRRARRPVGPALCRQPSLGGGRHPFAHHRSRHHDRGYRGPVRKRTVWSLYSWAHCRRLQPTLMTTTLALPPPKPATSARALAVHRCGVPSHWSPTIRWK